MKPSKKYDSKSLEITSKRRIAREVGVGKDTVRRYYDEIQKWMSEHS